MNTKLLTLLLLFSFLTYTPSLFAQGETEPVEEEIKTNKNEKVKAPKDYETYVKTIKKVSKMTREEKNTMSQCPLHAKEMVLSDNYRANASDYTTCFEYPFAYQLNYRRYCKVCTKIMAKESGEEMPMISKGTFERCGVHNSPLKGNPDYDNVMYERKPSNNMPHARQYWFKNYCKICTKVFKQSTKE